MEKYISIIGMEVHVELATKSKMFCSCKNDTNENQSNTNICEICTGQPGTLPVPNKKAIEWTVKIGKALNCKINETSKFDRKHYFYPDLPKAYQISQYDEPIAYNGTMNLDMKLEDNIRKNADIGIERVHLEEDTAKLIHNKKNATLVDFNRAGVPLVEIVTKPDFKSAVEAKIYCKNLRTLFRYLGVSDADMEKGQMRCEANISVQPAGSFEIVKGVVKPLDDHKLNHKVELKNLNSFKAVEKAIEYEIERQLNLLKKNKTWQQQTRGWDEKKQETILQRTKENAEDYRYFPEPDIPPFHPMEIAGKIDIGETPIEKQNRFHSEYGFSLSDSKILTNDRQWADFTESVMSELVDWLYSLPEVKGESDKIKEDKKNKIARLAGGWLTSKLTGIMSEKNKVIADIKLSAENFAELIALVYTNKVNSTNAQKILLEMVEAETDKDPTHIMEEKGYGQVSDERELSKIISDTIKSYPKQVEEYKSGKEAVLKFLVGMVMKATEGTADPQVVDKLLKEQLSK
ncbi:MAG: Asp-tRNA(Asn)/Glu-tRNA(Gln) amidotransferase subunit GatB [Candidatus Magasanikbacteria bacterium]|nr:Asp-tRNA(Asn)/Glu-tRNA(Gln) amidotransferase subunit GatB [Candidatus Magasanikbacteria bacterium]